MVYKQDKHPRLLPECLPDLPTYSVKYVAAPNELYMKKNFFYMITFMMKTTLQHIQSLFFHTFTQLVLTDPLSEGKHIEPVNFCELIHELWRKKKDHIFSFSSLRCLELKIIVECLCKPSLYSVIFTAVVGTFRISCSKIQSRSKIQNVKSSSSFQTGKVSVKFLPESDFSLFFGSSGSELPFQN